MKEEVRRLKEGNQRFVKEQSSEVLATKTHRAHLATGQSPFAIILSCSDSRVPPEVIFDQGLGELFVVRVAGNIVAPSQIGSIEYAAEMFGSKLIVVLGHSNCGAVEATLNSLAQEKNIASPNLQSIVSRITPAVEAGDNEGLPMYERMNHAVKANVLASVEQLTHCSEVIKALVATGNLKILGAEYSLESGKVTFFDD